jgi:hypothetical protein
MKPDEPAHPIDISFLGTYAVMLIPNTLTHLIKQAHKFKRWPFSRLSGFDWMLSTFHINRISTKSLIRRMIPEMTHANIELKQWTIPAILLSTPSFARFISEHSPP